MMELEERFHALMLERVYRETGRQCGYWAHRFRQLVAAHGGVAAAKRLLARRRVSPGFTVLKEKGRLDLSMEALVTEPQSGELFTDAERAAARRRLEGAPPPAGASRIGGDVPHPAA
jgi:hypothetical protein